MLSAASFDATLAGLGLSGEARTFERLVAAYAEPGRYYHDARHIVACLDALADNCDLAVHRHEVEVALWFHDAIYDTHRSDNEERSAEWAADFLTTQGLETNAIRRVHTLIMATNHNVAASGSDQCLLVDIDLGILGQSAIAFRRYHSAIRKEYSWVPTAQYRAARIAVLRSFVARPSIYQTERFRQRYEQQARENIRSAIAELEAGT
jgi:predicted metal-dependent HD superfamily phosphohydrolase